MAANYPVDVILQQLRVMQGDANDTLWSLDDKIGAMYMAADRAWPEWYGDWRFDRYIYDANVFVYSIPNGMVDVMAVYTTDDNGKPHYLQEWAVEGSRLILAETRPERNNETLYLYGITRPEMPSYIKTGQGGVTATNVGNVIAFSGVNLYTRGVRPGNIVTIDGAIYRVKTILSSTQLETWEDLGDVSGSVVAIGMETGVPLTYMVHMASYILYQMDMGRNNNVDTSRSIEMANFHYQAAIAELHRQKRPMPSRRK